VDRAIVDKYTRVGERAVVGHGDGPADPKLAWLGGLTLVGKDAMIPSEARVGRGAVIGVGARPSDFAEAALPAGAAIPSRAWYEGGA
jgi:carbonic anhydrase/acetyltransferase-like protein (isoleucine patch superfamily)